MIHSFDFFDTLFTRKVARPVSIFSLIGRNLEEYSELELPEEFCQNFSDIRIWAEKSARMNNPGAEDIHFNDIYKVIEVVYKIPSEVIKKIQEVELKIEEENLIPISSGIKILREEVISGRDPFVISDMYLPSDFLKNVLVSYDPSFHKIKVYVSGEHKKMKETGSIYKHLRKELSLGGKKWRHIGDNVAADVYQARKNKIQAELFVEAILEPNEIKFANNMKNLSFDLLAGKWRELRVCGTNDRYYFGYKYITSMFFGFIFETLKQLEEKGVNKVFFLARDGQVLKVIADQIITTLGYKIRSEYVYISRGSVFLPSRFELDEDFWIKVFDGFNLTIGRISTRLEMSASELMNFLESKKFSEKTELSKSQLSNLQNELRRNQELRTYLLQKAKEKRLNVMAYFSRLGFFEQDEINVVDVGWNGTISDSIYRICRSHNKNFRLSSWFLGVKSQSQYTHQLNKKNAYLFDSDELKPRVIGWIEFYIELLAQADHGQTKSYSLDGSPELKETNKSLIAFMDFPEVHRGISEGTSFMLSLLQDDKMYFDSKRVAAYVIEEFKNPAPLFVSLMGKIPFSPDQNDINLKTAAPLIGWRELFFFTFTRRDRSAITSWVEGSTTISYHPYIALLILTCLRFRAELILSLRLLKKLLAHTYRSRKIW